MKRLVPLTSEKHDQVCDKLRDMSEAMTDIANTIGAAYGAGWCDKAGAIRRALERLEFQIADHPKHRKASR